VAMPHRHMIADPGISQVVDSLAGVGACNL
jgi:hypothetical protein